MAFSTPVFRLASNPETYFLTRAGGLGVMTSPLQGEDRRFDSAPAHHSRRKQKMLGQNFLIDDNIANKIVNLASIKDGEKILEIYDRLRNRRNQPAKVLSGGERRLLEISRALVMKPSILLVDEPSIGLEPRYIKMVFEILEDLQKNEKKTIILVEQNAKKGLEFADIGYVLVSGQTAIDGKGDDLLNNPDVGRLFLGG